MKQALLLIIIITVVACGEESSRDSSPAPTATMTVSPATPTPTIEIFPTIVVNITPTPCVPNPEWEDTYTVVQGDTLGEIALAAGISVRELQLGNCILNRDFVQVGDVLRVPNFIAVDAATSTEGYDGLIVFVRATEEGFRELWTIKADGSILRQLTQETRVIDGPIRSPNNQWFAYRIVSPFYDADMSDIWAMKVDGTGMIELAEQGPEDNLVRSEPAWSPDSEHLAYTEQVGDRGALIIINPDGSERFVAHAGDFTPVGSKDPVAPAWSPDGSILVFLEWEPNGTYLKGFQIDDLTTSTITTITDYREGPIWIPMDGDTGPPAIGVGMREQAWYLINPETHETTIHNGQKVLVAPTLDWYIDDENLLWGIDGSFYDLTLPSTYSWSPLSDQLVVATSEGLQIVTINSDDGQILTNDPSDQFPAWSPRLWLVLP